MKKTILFGIMVLFLISLVNAAEDNITMILDNPYTPSAIDNITLILNHSTTGPFISTFSTSWDTTSTSTGSSNSTSISLPLISSGVYNFTVDWGDGNTTIVTTWNTNNSNHSYTTSGIKIINITGTIVGWAFNGAGDRNKIRNVTSWGPLRVGNVSNYFYDCQYLDITATDELNMTNTTNCAGFFNSQSTPNNNFNGSIEHLNVSGCTSFSFFLYNNPNFNRNISGWDTSKVTTMSNMFAVGSGSSSFNQDIGNWDTGKVTSFASMFSRAGSFNQNLSKWNTSSATAMNSMFANAATFNGNISNWDISHVTTTATMFNAARDFNSDLSKWNTSQVTTFSGMFNGAYNFTSNLSAWDVHNATTFQQMFYQTYKFNSDLNNWNISKANTQTSFLRMFYTAIAFDSNLSKWKFNTASFDFTEMFRFATVFNGDLSGWDTRNIKNMSGMFQSAKAFNQSLTTWNTSNVINMVDMFYFADNFNGNIGTWDVHNVTNMSEMFDQTLAFNQNLSAWNTASLVDTSYMFYQASAFNGDISGWNTGKIITMRSMFNDAISFNKPLNTWNTSSLKTTTNMFNGASSFNQPLTNWDMTKVTALSSMFYMASNFNGDISTWKFNGSSLSFGSVFYNATNFNQDISGWNITNSSSFSSTFLNSGMSMTNYDKLLLSWSTKTMRSNVVFNISAPYSCLGAPGKEILNSSISYNWTLGDAGLNTSYVCNTCTYSGTGNWLINLADGCNLTTNTVLNGGFESYGGPGFISINANITNASYVTLKSKVDNTSWCYQETANISTPCGGLATGSYKEADNSPYFYSDFSKLMDGDWTTFTSCNNVGSCSMFVNYTIPVSTLAILLQVKDGDGIPTNLTIPNNCKLGTTLQLNHSKSEGWYCLNQSTWQSIGGVGYAPNFEEAAWFLIGEVGCTTSTCEVRCNSGGCVGK